MNALELADDLEEKYLNGMECEHGFLVFENNGCSNEYCEQQGFYKATTMLRQQHAEIEALKKKIQNMALDLLTAHAQADDHWVELQKLRGEK